MAVRLPRNYQYNVYCVDMDDLSKRENFLQTVKCFRENLEQKDDLDDLLKNAQYLYNWLISPLMEGLEKQIDTLIIVPDGILRTIPFAALHNGKNFLVQQYALGVTPGIKLTVSNKPLLDNFRILLSGTGKFEDDDNDIDSLSYVPAELNKISCVLTDNLDPQKDENFTLSSLKRWQTKSDCSLEGKVDILLNEKFTVPKVEAQLKNTPYSIVHFATHGHFDYSPQETYLKTFEGELEDQGEGGKITMNKLETWVRFAQWLKWDRFAELKTQPIELLTLSACETAKGNEHAALGLACVALKAGARSALATLWQVKDPSTAQVMVEFYRQLKKDPNQSKAQALQKAQRQLLEKESERDKKYEHPYYWAPFLLIGNWL